MSDYFIEQARAWLKACGESRWRPADQEKSLAALLARVAGEHEGGVPPPGSRLWRCEQELAKAHARAGNAEEALVLAEERVAMRLDETTAKWIRVLRVDLECSWGRVGELYKAVTGEVLGGGVQQSGAALCEWAAKLLGEEPGEAPWN